MSIEAMKQALEWAYNHGEIVFAGGGMKAVDGMNAWAQSLRQAIAEAEKRHYCPEWDFLEITKDDPEFEACLCFSQKPDAWVADVGEPPTEEEKQEHITDGSTCWCGPETNYTDPETGASVIVHREPQ